MTCECSDPGCPCAVSGHSGDITTLYRVDMEDRTGTLMCETCGDDAFESGVFTSERP